jgi:hypothetical protein
LGLHEQIELLFVADRVFVDGRYAAEARVEFKLNVKGEALCCPNVVAVQDELAVA